jgi:hypothetical protein
MQAGTLAVPPQEGDDGIAGLAKFWLVLSTFADPKAMIRPRIEKYCFRSGHQSNYCPLRLYCCNNRRAPQIPTSVGSHTNVVDLLSRNLPQKRFHPPIVYTDGLSAGERCLVFR